MRDLKFRAYDKFAEKMMDDEDIGVLPSNDTIGTTSYGNVTLINASNEHYVIMQYTGMNDKNGAEIYESDIVQFTTFGRTVRGLVEWDDDDGLPGFVIVDSDGSGTIWDFMYDDLTKIGNKYKNPELLESHT